MEDAFALIKEHLPHEGEVKFSVGPYQVLETIGKGGMGEVYLAYDTICKRRIALKRIRPDIVKYEKIKKRFLKEAHVTSQLSHHSIVPIYNIHKEENKIYYTMPYLQGETLKQIINRTRKQEKAGKELDHIGGSIPALIRIFINICQAVAYAHSKGVLHRDLKPENIIIGEYGELFILDWGLAKLIGPEEEEEEEVPEIKGGSLSGITQAGRVVGTVSYMAPERALGGPSTVQTDIYALGVILYQLLTLHMPFRRGSLDEFRKKHKKEKLRILTKVAPYRDIPRMLAKMTARCLEPDPENRYSTVEELLHDLENYVEGRAEWFEIAKLNPKKKRDWEFQENVFLNEHVAITRASEASEWMNLMISKASFGSNVRLEASVKIGERGDGVGFLLNIPETAERKHLNDGYCLWIGSDLNRTTKLMRAAVEEIHAPETYIKRGRWYKVRIDNVDGNIHFYLDGVLQFSTISHLPLFGTHVGLLARDADYKIRNLSVFMGGQSVTVKCLAVPDAFLAHKDYATALTEYRRIAYAFAGRAEGREAMFKAGITLLEQAKNCANGTKAEKLYDLALEEFEKLHNTAGAPFEYLGKALVYQSLYDYEEEIKCFELGCRRYPCHPLLSVLHEQIVHRMYESSRYHRQATYRFALLTVRHLPEEIINSFKAQKLFSNLQKNWEPLFFTGKDFATTLAFWLARPYILEEIFGDLQEPAEKEALLFSLLNLGCRELAEKLSEDFPAVQQAIAFEKSPSKEKIEEIAKGEEPLILHACQYALDHDLQDILEPIWEREVSEENRIYFDRFHIWTLLLQKKWKEAGEIFEGYPIETVGKESFHLHSLYGCWLLATEGKELATIHFSSVLEASHPRSWALLSHFLSRKIHKEHAWFQRAFLFEKKELYRQLSLYCSLLGDDEKARIYRETAVNETAR